MIRHPKSSPTRQRRRAGERAVSKFKAKQAEAGQKVLARSGILPVRNEKIIQKIEARSNIPEKPSKTARDGPRRL